MAINKDKKDRIIITVDKEIKDKLKELADKDDRNLSNYLSKLLKEYVEGK